MSEIPSPVSVALTRLYEHALTAAYLRPDLDPREMDDDVETVRDALRALAKASTPRIVTEADEAAQREHNEQRTIRCHACNQWLRYVEKDVVTDLARDQRHVMCPCGRERVIALGVRPRPTEEVYRCDNCRRVHDAKNDGHPCQTIYCDTRTRPRGTVRSVKE